MTIRDGRITSARFPDHHPLCHGASKESFVIQQLDRLWKAIAVYETPELRSSYVALRELAPKEADALYSEMENPQGRFPDWEMLRQMAERCKRSFKKYVLRLYAHFFVFADHNQYSIRLIKYPSPHDEPTNREQYALEEEAAAESDGMRALDTCAWITESIVELDEAVDESQEVVESQEVPTSSKRAINETPKHTQAAAVEDTTAVAAAQAQQTSLAPDEPPIEVPQDEEPNMTTPSHERDEAPRTESMTLRTRSQRKTKQPMFV